MRLFFVHILAITCLSIRADAQIGSCPYGVYERKEVRELTPTEWSDFVAAVRQLQSGPSPTAYDRFVKIHIDNKDHTHGWPQFFPWHRYFIHLFERELQAINPRVRLPYWDWGYDSQSPESSPIFSARFFGGNGRGEGMCVQDGAFANWRPAYPTPHCYSRNWDGGDRISAFYGTDLLNQAITSHTVYDSFRQAIEIAPHGAVHNNMGGEFPNMHSPNDPLFWAHHGMIDKIYADWQRTHPDAANTFNGVNFDGTAASPDTELAGLGVRVRDVFDTRRLCYTYKDMGARAVRSAPMTASATPGSGLTAWGRTQTWTPQRSRRLLRRDDYVLGSITPQPDVSPEDRENLVLLRQPRPIPMEWCQMNGFEVHEVRAVEEVYAHAIRQINAIDDYVSPTALWLRTDLCERLIETNLTSKFTATVRGKHAEVRVKDLYTDGLFNTTALVDVMKSRVRDQCGGLVRGQPDRYMERLQQYIGPIVAPVGSVEYLATVPTTRLNDAPANFTTKAEPPIAMTAVGHVVLTRNDKAHAPRRHRW